MPDVASYLMVHFCWFEASCHHIDSNESSGAETAPVISIIDVPACDMLRITSDPYLDWSQRLNFRG